MVANADIAADIRAQIDRSLDAVAAKHGVRILLAVESGSRAWGFPSPDSDYDVRFVYAHELDWYLSIDDRRNVIELPIANDLDIVGWDIRKALSLLIKPNPVLLEWLCSPVVYRTNPATVERLRALAARTAHQRPSTYHYLQLCRTQYRRFIEARDEVPIKKYFYSLRPALALVWLAQKPSDAVPMTLSALRAGLDLPVAVSTFLDDLLRRKAVTRELGTGPREPALDRLIRDAMAAAEARLQTLAPPAASLVDEANALFRDIVTKAV